MLVAGAVCALAPASALAASAKVVTFSDGNKQLQYHETGPLGEVNDVKLERVLVPRLNPTDPKEVRFRFTESGAGVSISDGDGTGGCDTSGSVATCPATGVVSTIFVLGTGSDRAINEASLRSFVFGEGGSDTLIGGSGPDSLDGGDGEDELEGGGGDDVAFGQNGGDPLADGGDRFIGGPGADFFQGGRGEDSASYVDHSGGVSVDLGGGANDGNATDGPAGARDEVREDVEEVLGGSGNDRLTGSAGGQSLYGFGGNDVLDGGFGADILSAGAGTDTASYASRSQGVPVDLGDLSDDGNADDQSGTERDSLGGFENVVGGAGADSLLGDSGPNRLDGAAGADLVVGRAGVDRLFGGIAADRVLGGGGRDALRGGAGGDRLDGGFEGDDMGGGAGVDTSTYANRTAGVRVDLDGVADDGAGGDSARTDNVRGDVENVIGGNGGDFLTGNALVNVLAGGRGPDTINARDRTTRRDQVRCGPGVDRFRRNRSDRLFACERPF